MTDEELKELVASLAVSHQKTTVEINELRALQREVSLQMKDTDKRMKDTDKQMKETDERMKETAERMKETAERIKETDLQVKELGKQIGGLGAKFGSFTEGLALPSMEKILHDQFMMEVVTPSVRVSKAGKHLEIDVLAYANSEVNEAYIVEVKSHAREESIRQIQEMLENFRKFFPEHKDKTVYGILAAVDMSAAIREMALKAGLYVARIKDEVFNLDVPANFHPKAY